MTSLEDKQKDKANTVTLGLKQTLKQNHRRYPHKNQVVDERRNFARRLALTLIKEHDRNHNQPCSRPLPLPPPPRMHPHQANVCNQRSHYKSVLELIQRLQQQLTCQIANTAAKTVPPVKEKIALTMISCPAKEMRLLT